MLSISDLKYDDGLCAFHNHEYLLYSHNLTDISNQSEAVKVHGIKHSKVLTFTLIS